MIIRPKKIGIIPCCGTECAGGYITRIAAGKVIHELRPAQVATISLPRLLFGTSEDKKFSRLQPTITIDGCQKACAKKAVEKYGGKVTLAISMEDIIGPTAPYKEALPIAEFVKEHAAEIRKVTGVITYVVDTMMNMANKNGQGCGTSCDCGCGGNSGCGCGCEGEEHSHSHHHNQPHTASTADEGKDVIIYTKTGCPFCAKTVFEYQEKGIHFREVNISLDASARKLCSDTYGADRVPVIVKDGVVAQIGDIDGKG